MMNTNEKIIIVGGVVIAGIVVYNLASNGINSFTQNLTQSISALLSGQGGGSSSNDPTTIIIPAQTSNSTPQQPSVTISPPPQPTYYNFSPPPPPQTGGGGGGGAIAFPGADTFFYNTPVPVNIGSLNSAATTAIATGKPQAVTSGIATTTITPVKTSSGTPTVRATQTINPAAY